ncbi:MAG: hypothetical protein JSW20_07090 [Nitrospiraceae bacterium]|nr:MAG: hypothetical protein JSW20_07090 [Nitrospiraceae bacterium]
MSRKSEEIRIRYLYRKMLLRGQLSLPLKFAVKMVGPDCAYHLYSHAGFVKKKNKGRE